MDTFQHKDSGIFNDTPRAALPNATAVLVLGIISIVGCLCYGVLGTICGIIALVLAQRDMKLYNLNPGFYFPTSYSNLKAGRICALIGLILSVLFMLFMICILAIIGLAGLQHPDQFFNNL